MKSPEVTRVALVNSARRWIGEAAHTLALAKGLEARGVTVALVARRGQPLETRAREAGLCVEVLEFSSRFSLGKDVADWRGMRRIIRDHGVQVVHCHRGKDHWTAALARLGMGNRPALVRTRHVVVPMRQNLLNRWLLRRATDLTMAVSDAARRGLGGVLPEPLLTEVPVVHSGVDLDRFHPGKRSDEIRTDLFGASPDERVVGLIGRIQRVKGQAVLLEAASRLIAEGCAARFIIAGAERSPGRLERLRESAAEMGIADRVAFLGEVEEIAPVIASLDVGVIASLGSEGSSRVALEMMASRVPVIATRVGVLPEWIRDGENGLLCDPGDAVQLAGAIRRLLGDDDLRSRIAAAGRSCAETHHRLDAWVSRVQEIYAEALSKRA